MYTHCPDYGAGSDNFSLNIIPKFALNCSKLNRKSKQQLISNKNFGNLLV